MGKIIHQATYGEKNNGHRLLNHTFEENVIPSSIVLKTDLPSGPPSTIKWQPFFSSHQLKEFYVLTKTFPDLQAQRSSFVFTHAIFVKREIVSEINDLGVLMNLLPNDYSKNSQLSVINYESIEKSIPSPTVSDSVKKAAFSLVNKEKPVVWIGQKGFTNTVRVIWNNICPEDRFHFTFRLSFGPRDIRNSDLTMVVVPIGLKNKWDHKFLITYNDSFSEQFNEAIQFLTKGLNYVPKLKSLKEKLEVPTIRLEELVFFQKLIKVLNKNTGDSLKYAVSLVNIISPDKKKGIVFKEGVLERLTHKLDGGTLDDVLSLRNISSVSFPNFKPVKECCKGILKQNFFSTDDFEKKEKIIEALGSPDVSTWWISTNKEFLNEALSNWDYSCSNFFWKLLEFRPSALEQVGKFIGDDKKIESQLLEVFPDDDQIEFNDDIVRFFKERDWHKLHAKSLISLKPLKEVLEEQLLINKGEESIDGLKLIANEASSKNFIELSLSKSDSRLKKISANLISQNPKLLENIDISSLEWLEIWDLANSRGMPLFQAVNEPQDIVFKLIDRLLQGNEVPTSLLEKISKSAYASLLNYGSRKKVWKYLPSNVKKNFLEATAEHWIENYINEPKPIDLEPSLKKEVSDKKRIFRLIESEISNSSILDLIEGLNIYEEDLLNSFLKKRVTSFDKGTSRRLGKIISSNEMRQSYLLVKDNLIKKNRNLNVLLKECEDTFDWIDHPYWGIFSSFFSSENSLKDRQKLDLMSQKLRKKTVVILTAIQVEYNAVKGFLNDYSEVSHSSTGTIYGTGSYGENWEVKICESEAGNQQAAIEAQRAIEYFDPDYVFFVGVAGGLKDVKIGDIVIASKVYGYESGKADKKYKPRFEFGRPDYRLKEIAKSIRKDGEWLTEISDVVSEKMGSDIRIDAYFKPIAAGEKVISSTDSPEYQFLKEHASDSLAVEMEGIGFLKACEPYRAKSLLIRGISDLIDNKDETDRKGGQELASFNASAFAFEVLDRLHEG